MHMIDPLSRIVTRAAYGARQLSRVAWYLGHGLALRRIAEAQRRRERPNCPPRARIGARVPDRRRLYSDMATLFLQDLTNVESGIYPLPADHDGSLTAFFRRSRLFFEDLPEIHRRRERNAYHEVLNKETIGTRPRYYLQNFHFQSGGWMTEASAERYDTQVEVLLNGSANAMRRQALPPLHAAFAGRDKRKLSLIDIGCGTGRFLDFLKQAWPRLPVLGLDMSEAYIKHARRHLKRWSRIGLMVGNAEAIPVPDASQDAVTRSFLISRIAAQGAPRRDERVRAGIKARRSACARRLSSARRRARLRRTLGSLSAELPRALLSDLYR